MDKSILCRIGIHNWRPLGCASLITLADYEYCGRCMIGRVRGWDATWRYPAEETRRLLIESMRQNGAEIAP